MRVDIVCFMCYNIWNTMGNYAILHFSYNYTGGVSIV